MLALTTQSGITALLGMCTTSLSAVALRARTVVVAVITLTLSQALHAAPATGMHASPSSVSIVHVGHLIADASQAPASEFSLVIDGERIVSVEQGYLAAADLPEPLGQRVSGVIDLKDSWVLPGLIDVHVHFAPSDKLHLVTKSDAYLATMAIANARKTLHAGFTTVRDLGSPGALVHSVRDGINDGLIEGPRILSAGQILSKTGAHADLSNGYRPDFSGLMQHRSYQCVGAHECERKVLQIAAQGANVIKVVADRSVTAEGPVDFNDAEFSAIVDTAKRLGLGVAVHAHTEAAAAAALRAGVRSLEHGTFANAESFMLMKEADAYYSPTLSAFVAIKASLAQYPPAVQAQFAPAVENIGAALRTARDTGVKIVLGTDAGVIPHGSNASELEAMMTHGGLSAQEALIAATQAAADLLGMSDQVGTLKPGAYADFVAVADNPLETITVLQTPQAVMKGGRMVLQ